MTDSYKPQSPEIGALINLYKSCMYSTSARFLLVTQI
jgi:hypothetical protein